MLLGVLAASLSLKVAKDKYIHANYKSLLAKLATSVPYADNYLFSSRSKERLVKELITRNMECLLRLPLTTLDQ